MAKRKRLIVPGLSHGLGSDLGEDFAETVSVPAENGPFPGPARPAATAPITLVAGEAAGHAALEELATEVARARTEGRLARALPLKQIDEGYLVRDRIGFDEEELESLMASLSAWGQRTAIEVTDLGADNAAGRYGLISGWRRLTALKRLFAATGEARFATVLAVERRPEAAGEAWIAMIEENEIRLGLSYYERARIAARAVEAGVFADLRSSLQSLFGNASRARRSKIGSFVTIHDALGDVLRFPAAIPERLGLTLAKALSEDPGLAARMRPALAVPLADAEAERRLLVKLAAPVAGTARSGRPNLDQGLRRQTPGVMLEMKGDRIGLSGTGVDAALFEDLSTWLESRRG